MAPARWYSPPRGSTVKSRSVVISSCVIRRREPAPFRLVPGSSPSRSRRHREDVTVYPTSNLVDGQSVTVAARNFEPSRFVLTTQCATADGDPAHCWNTHAVIYAQIGADGSAVRTGQVVRSLPTPSGTVDCATQTCYLASEDITDYHHRWIVAIQLTTGPETTTTTATTSAVGTLPKTGGSNGDLAWGGVLAVVVGWIMVAVGRRRTLSSAGCSS